MATLREIAMEAGVSVDTVSRVLNGKNKEVWPSALRRADEIRQIASRLGFRPNSAARAMRSRRTKHVGVLIRNRPGTSRHTHPLAFETVLGINEGLQSVGYVLSIIRITDVLDADSRVFQEHVLDGMIVVDAMPTAVQEELERRVEHCLWVDSNVWMPKRCIRRDEVTAGGIAAERAVGLGYKKLVWAGLSPGPERNYSLQERHEGVRSVASTRGVELRDLHLASGHATHLDPAFIDHLRPDTCIIAYGIYQARSIAHLAASVGKSPAFDFGLVCCDDSHDVHRMWPGLSRVTFDRFDMGLKAADMMLRLLEEPTSDFTSTKVRGYWHAGNTAWGPHISVSAHPTRI